MQFPILPVHSHPRNNRPGSFAGLVISTHPVAVVCQFNQFLARKLNVRDSAICQWVAYHFLAKLSHGVHLCFVVLVHRSNLSINPDTLKRAGYFGALGFIAVPSFSDHPESAVAVVVGTAQCRTSGRCGVDIPRNIRHCRRSLQRCRYVDRSTYSICASKTCLTFLCTGLLRSR